MPSPCQRNLEPAGISRLPRSKRGIRLDGGEDVLVYNIPDNAKQKPHTTIKAMHLPLLGAGLFVFWLLLSGYWSNPLIVALGIASCGLAVILSARIRQKYRLASPWTIVRRLPRYLAWLLFEILKANIAVVRNIWLPERYPISPTVKRFPIHSCSRLCQTIYANSITLTPGTVSFDVSDDQITVHAIEEGAIAELMDGEMNDRVAALEDSR